MVNWNRAINAGLVGAAAMTLAGILVRTLGITTMNLELMLGTMVTSQVGMGSWGLGLLIHLVLGALFGLLYGAVMEALGKSGWEVGLGIATVHVVVTGLALPLIGAAHPLVRSGQLAPPGVFASGLGVVGVVLYVALHWLYGVIVGRSYVVLSTVTEPGFTPAARRRPPSTVLRG